MLKQTSFAVNCWHSPILIQMEGFWNISLHTTEVFQIYILQGPKPRKDWLWMWWHFLQVWSSANLAATYRSSPSASVSSPWLPSLLIGVILPSFSASLFLVESFSSVKADLNLNLMKTQVQCDHKATQTATLQVQNNGNRRHHLDARWEHLISTFSLLVL